MCSCWSTILDYCPIRIRQKGNGRRRIRQWRIHMKDRYVLVVIALIVIITSSWAAAQQPTPGTVGGCPTEPLAFHLCALDKAKTFNPPRTPSGKPNLQGHYRARLAQSYSFEGVSGSEPQRSEEHTSELQSPCNLVCRLLL